MTPNPFLLPYNNRNNDSEEKDYVKKILFIKPTASPWSCFNELQLRRIKDLKYLKRLNAIVGLFPKDSLLDRFIKHPDIYHIDEDIEIQIHVPFKGEIIAKSQVIPWGIKRVGAEKVWRFTQGERVRVAVIDTGIAFDHPDLKNNIKGGINILKPYLPPYDHNGHGTHVSGTIGAVNNQLGVVGVAPKVNLFAVKAFNKDGTAKLSDIIKAIDWCIEHRMNIINMSFGFNEPNNSFKEAIIKAQQAGILMIAASGNKGTRGRLEYPAQFDEVVAVSSINEKNEISDFSTIGPNVDLTAPGEKITSTWLNNSFRELSGTSMSVAHVTGVAALILSKYPNMSSEQIKSYLGQSATRLRDISSYAQGAGVVNASILARSY